MRRVDGALSTAFHSGEPIETARGDILPELAIRPWLHLHVSAASPYSMACFAFARSHSCSAQNSNSLHEKCEEAGVRRRHGQSVAAGICRSRGAAGDSDALRVVRPKGRHTRGESGSRVSGYGEWVLATIQDRGRLQMRITQVSRPAGRQGRLTAATSAADGVWQAKSPLPPSIGGKRVRARVQRMRKSSTVRSCLVPDPAPAPAPNPKLDGPNQVWLFALLR